MRAVGHGHGEKREGAGSDLHWVSREELPGDGATISGEAGEIESAGLETDLEVAFPGRPVGGEPIGDEREDFGTDVAQGVVGGRSADHVGPMLG